MSGRYREDEYKGGGGGSRWDRRDSGGGGYGRRDGGGGYHGGHHGGGGGGGGQYRQGGGGYRGGGGGGGGYRGGGGGGGQRRHQTSFVGQKRGREEAALDPKKQFITRLLKLGQPGQLSESDKTSAGDTPEKTIENALWAFKQEIKHKTENLNEVVLEAVVSCSHKTLHYALLLGLLHGENPDWVTSFVAAAGQRFESELAAGQVDGPRLLLRLFACLSRASVLHHADVLGLLQRLVEAAASLAAAGADPSGLTWQPWADQLVYMVLGALVWGGLALQDACPAEHSSLVDALGSYMAARPMQESVELRPMYGASDASDASAASDSGGASFLGQLWDAVQVLASPEVNWAVQSIPSQLLDTFHAKLAGQAAAELPPIQLPQGVPGLPAGAAGEGPLQRAQTALALQDRYPPRGGMVVLDSQYTDGGRIAAERFVAEEYIIDLLGAFDSHRVELAQMLCSGLPLPYDYSGLLCETLFAQLLRLPSPRLCPVAFSALIAHAALLRPAFPKYLAGSVRQLYLRLQFLAPELAGRLADVLAHFITNMNFRWPWDRYRAGLSQPPGGPQRTFLVLVLQHLVRLTAWDHQMLLQETPPDFLALLGEQPGFSGLPTPEPYPPPPKPPTLPPPPAAAAAGDEAMADADADAAAAAAAAAAGSGDGEDAAAAAPDAMQQDHQQETAVQPEEEEQQQQQGDGDQPMQETGDGQQQQGAAAADPEMVWAGKLLGVMQARPPPQHKPLSYEQVLEWMEQQQMSQALGSPEAQLRAVARAVLAAGSKSCSHCYVLLERYSPLLQQLLGEAGQGWGQQLLLELLGSMYSSMSQRLSLAMARLQELGLLGAEDCVKWLIASPMLQFGPAPHEASASDAWALLHSILSGTLARYEGALQHKARLQDAVKKAQGKLNAASEESAAAVEAQQQAEEAAARGEEGGEDGNAQRQRIVWPGGEGGGSRSGPVHRAEVAALREQLMAKKLAAAEEALSHHEAGLAGMEAARGMTLLQAFQGLVSRLLEALAAIAQQAADAEVAAAAAADMQQPDEEQDGADAEEQQKQQQQAAAAAAVAAAEAARRLCLAQMQGFSLAYSSQVVSLGLAEQLLQHVDSLALENQDVRAAILGPLYLA